MYEGGSLALCVCVFVSLEGVGPWLALRELILCRLMLSPLTPDLGLPTC